MQNHWNQSLLQHGIKNTYKSFKKFFFHNKIDQHSDSTKGKTVIKITTMPNCEKVITSHAKCVGWELPWEVS